MMLEADSLRGKNGLSKSDVVRDFSYDLHGFVSAFWAVFEMI
jgi:hypothetical protein